MKNIGLKIKIARIAKQLTQEELADKINKTRPLISHIEQTGKVNHHTLTKICQVLDVSIEEIESEVSEPSGVYRSNSLQSLKNEIARLNEEVQLYKDLVTSQKEIILELRSKLKRKRS